MPYVRLSATRPVSGCAPPGTRFPLAVLAAFGVVVSQMGCDVSVRDGNISAEILTGTATREWAREYPLVAGGYVEIVNVSGAVEVTGAAIESVAVKATITAKALTEKHAKVVLDRGRMEESATSDRIRVASVPPRSSHGQSYSVRYEVRVPAHAQVEIASVNSTLTVRGVGGGLKASLTNGTVDLENVPAPIDVSAVNGQIVARLSKVAGNVRLETNNGRISLEIPASTSATISARTVNGGVNVTGLPVAVPERRRQRRFDASLNGGGSDIELRTTNGRINITGTP